MTIAVWFDPSICSIYDFFYDLNPNFLPRLHLLPQYSEPVRVRDNILCIEDFETDVLFVPIDTARRNVKGDVVLIPKHFSGDCLEIAKASARSSLIAFYDQEKVPPMDFPAWHDKVEKGENNG